ncbi:MAG: glycosyltransferase family 4 protein [Bacteroidota bacterium]
MRKKHIKTFDQFNDEKFRIIYSRPLKNHHRLFFRSKVTYLVKDLKAKVDVKTMDLLFATTLFSDGAIALRLKKLYGLPYVIAVRSTDIDLYMRYRKDLHGLASKILNGASAIVFISESLKKKFFSSNIFTKMSNEIEAKSYTVPNGIDAFWINKIQAKKVSSKNKILFVGYFLKRKNIVPLIKAVLLLNSKEETYQLDIVGKAGSPEEEAKIRKYSMQYDYINLLGPITDKEELKSIYARNDFFVMPSVRETFGLVYLEALSQGLPVIYAKGEAIDGIFDFKVGEMVDPNSVESIADGIGKVSKNHGQYELSRIDLAHFSWKSIANKYGNIFRSVIPPEKSK